VADEHRAYGVNGVVPVEPFGHQALHRTLYRNLIAQRDLILDNDVDDRMHLFVGQVNPCAPVEALHQLEALLLIHRLPLFGVGWLEGIIILHRAASELHPFAAPKP
jgi:hypothetical protein